MNNLAHQMFSLHDLGKDICRYLKWPYHEYLMFAHLLDLIDIQFGACGCTKMDYSTVVYLLLQ